MEHQLTAMTNAEERATLQIVRKYDINSAFQTNHSAKKMAFPCSSHVTFAILICCCLHPPQYFISSLLHPPQWLTIVFKFSPTSTGNEKGQFPVKGQNFMINIKLKTRNILLLLVYFFLYIVQSYL